MDLMNEINIDSLRMRLWDYIKENPTTFNSLCKEIGISNATLTNLLKNNPRYRGANFRVMLMINKFLDDKKKDINEQTN
jgi:Cro/C1-type helix-turn-helix DNA-binding protein